MIDGNYVDTGLSFDDGMNGTANEVSGNLLAKGIIKENDRDELKKELISVMKEALLNGLSSGFLTCVLSKPGQGDFDILRENIEKMNPELLSNPVWLKATKPGLEEEEYERGLVDGWDAAINGDPSDPIYARTKLITAALRSNRVEG